MAEYQVIHLWSPEWHECPLCGEFRHINHCVTFYEEPRPDLEIGGEIGGMSCCKECHDGVHADG